MKGGLQRQIGLIEASPPIPLESVDFGFANPGRVLEVFGRIFPYFGRVEGEVGGYVQLVSTMIPGSQEPGHPIGEFLPRWLGHEKQHGQIIDRAQEELGMTPIEVPPPDAPPIARLVGKAALVSPMFERILSAVYGLHGLRHEKLTDSGYRRILEMLDGIGEPAFAQTAILPISRQEPMHLVWYRQFVRDLLPDLSAKELKLTAMLDRVLYQPVGAKKRSNRADFGDVARALDPENTHETSRKVQEAGDKLLDAQLPKRRRTDFVAEKIQACIDLSEERQAA